MWRWVVVLAAIGLALAAGRAEAETPEEFYASVFQEEAKAALGTPATKDDVEFAAKVLDAARNSSDAAVRAYLCEKALDFACRAPEGCCTAMRLAKLLAEAAPPKRAAAQQKVLRACEAFFEKAQTPQEKQAAGAGYVEALVWTADAPPEANQPTDEARILSKAISAASAANLNLGHGVTLRLETAKAEQAADKELAKLDAAVKAAPANVQAAQRAVMLCVTEKDRPAMAAQRLAAAGRNEALEARVALACKALGDLSQDECLDLGAWYRGLAPQAGALGKARVLARAQGIYKRFLEVHPGEDPKTWMAKRALEAVNYDLVRARAGLNGGWLDLFSLIDRGRLDLKASEWQETPDGFLSKGTGSRLYAPYEPLGEYDVEASFTRKGGQDAISFSCPFGETGFALYLGDLGNKRSGLVPVWTRYLRADVSSPNPTARDLTLTEGHDYSVLIQVRGKGVRACLDEKVIVDHRTNGKDFSLALTPHTVGFGTIRSQAVFHSMWLREVTGPGKFLPAQETPR